MSQRDRTSQIIKCNSWSIKLHPYLSLIWKMRMYLELEGKLGLKPRPQPQIQLQPTQPQPSTSGYHQNNNPMTRKAPGPKTNDKRRRTMFAKRRYKVMVIAQPIRTTPTSTAPAPMVATVSIQIPATRSAAKSIPVTVYNLVKGKFSEVPFPTGRHQENPLVCNANPPPLEDIPKAPVREASPAPMQGQPQRTCLKQGKIGQFPLHMHQHPL